MRDTQKLNACSLGTEPSEMSSIRKFRDLASRLFRLTQVARRDDPLETVKEFDAMLDSIAEMLEVTDRDKKKPDTLSTVTEYEAPVFRDFFGAPNFSSDLAEEDKGPYLVIHKDQPTPTVKVTKVEEEGTSLDTLFHRMPTYEDDDGYVDHESLCSEDVGVDVDDEEDELVPIDIEGTSYLRSTATHRVFSKTEDGSQGPCVGVWMFQQFVPITVVPSETKSESTTVCDDPPPPLMTIPTVHVEKVET